MVASVVVALPARPRSLQCRCIGCGRRRASTAAAIAVEDAARREAEARHRVVEADGAPALVFQARTPPGSRPSPRRRGPRRAPRPGCAARRSSSPAASASQAAARRCPATHVEALVDDAACRASSRWAWRAPEQRHRGVERRGVAEQRVEPARWRGSWARCGAPARAAAPGSPSGRRRGSGCRRRPPSRRGRVASSRGASCGKRGDDAAVLDADVADLAVDAVRGVVDAAAGDAQALASCARLPGRAPRAPRRSGPGPRLRSADRGRPPARPRAGVRRTATPSMRNTEPRVAAAGAVAMKTALGSRPGAARRPQPHGGRAAELRLRLGREEVRGSAPTTSAASTSPRRSSASPLPVSSGRSAARRARSSRRRESPCARRARSRRPRRCRASARRRGARRPCGSPRGRACRGPRPAPARGGRRAVAVVDDDAVGAAREPRRQRAQRVEGQTGRRRDRGSTRRPRTNARRATRALQLLRPGQRQALVDPSRSARVAHVDRDARDRPAAAEASAREAGMLASGSQPQKTTRSACGSHAPSEAVDEPDLREAPRASAAPAWPRSRGAAPSDSARRAASRCASTVLSTSPKTRGRRAARSSRAAASPRPRRAMRPGVPRPGRRHARAGSGTQLSPRARGALDEALPSKRPASSPRAKTVQMGVRGGCARRERNVADVVAREPRRACRRATTSRRAHRTALPNTSCPDRAGRGGRRASAAAAPAWTANAEKRAAAAPGAPWTRSSAG